MKKTFGVLALATLLSGCTIFEFRYLKGDYYRGIVWQDSPQSFDQTFSKAIEVLTQRGVLASVVDRENGFIKLSMLASSFDITIEKKGKPRSPDRIIVAPEGTIFWGIAVDVVILVQPMGEDSRVGVRLIPSNKDIYAEGGRGETASLGNLERDIIQAITGQIDKK